MDEDQNKLKLLSTIHWMFIGSLVVLAIVGWFAPIEANRDLNDLLKYILIGLSFPAYFAGNFVRKNIINKIDKNAPLQEKLAQFQKATIIQWSAIDVPATFAGISFLLTRNTIYLIIIAVFILLLYMLKPNKDRIADDLDLNEQEKSQL